MPSPFAERFMATSAASLLAEHGEEVVYTPASGSPRTILAMLVRGELERSGAIPGAVGPVVAVLVRNSATDLSDGLGGGIDSDEINTGADTITLAVDVGATPKVLRIAQKAKQSAGMVRLTLR